LNGKKFLALEKRIAPTTTTNSSKSITCGTGEGRA